MGRGHSISAKDVDHQSMAVDEDMSVAISDDVPCDWIVDFFTGSVPGFRPFI